MSDNMLSLRRIKRVFEKAAAGDLITDNLSQVLSIAVREGFCTKGDIANVLGTQDAQVYQVANSLKPREVASLARALINL